jgi:peptidoglycan L-alanyl-D-glutamate endopeptidase CwlK
MPAFGKKSLENLNSAHNDLQALFNEVIKHFDCTVLEGFRGKERQNRLFSEGATKVKFPNSKHNHSPSLAVDVIRTP